MTMFAYVDPGLGLLAWQALVAACLGVVFYLKKTRIWILGLFGKTPNSPPAVTPSNPRSTLGDTIQPR